MPLRPNGLSLAGVLENEIQQRFEMRGLSRQLSKAEKRKVETVAGLAGERVPTGAISLLKAFVDHAWPVGSGRFMSIQKVFWAWEDFVADVWPQIAHLFPVTDEDDKVVSGFFRDWRELRKNLLYYKPVYYRSDRLGGGRLSKAYRNGPEFFRILSVLRKAQRNIDEFPFFTLRGFAAAQIEMLSTFVVQIGPGHLDTEKAWGRYREWLVYRYYPGLARKGLSRPSANNPTCNVAIRLDYERDRAARGDLAADHTFDGEEPVAWLSRPKVYFDAKVVDNEVPVPGNATIELPPGMTR
jgi:hypothetical protein